MSDLLPQKPSWRRRELRQEYHACGVWVRIGSQCLRLKLGRGIFGEETFECWDKDMD